MTTALALTYSHNVIEHLGLKLYQNKPTNVISELVSNSWDANALFAWVDVAMADTDFERYIAVHDNGHGMTREDLATKYLVIGAPKRATPGQKSKGNKRNLMGRKGIGKLAPFGIASTVDVVSAAIHEGTRSFTWIRLDLADIKKAVGPGQSATYLPKIIYEGKNPPETLLAKEDGSKQIARLLKRIGEGTGTLILLRDLTIHRSISEKILSESLGRRLSATLESGFTVAVNENPIEANLVWPEFEFRIPETGIETETVDGKEIRFWVGFVKSASWPQDQAGVGVYAHGKICQDRPFTFGAKGNEIFARYMSAVVEVDWLDELPDDLISTDRSSVNWDAEILKPLYNWGQKKVGQWTTRFEKWRQTEENKENRKRIVKAMDEKKAPMLSEQEQEAVANLLSGITPFLGKDEEGKEQLTKSISSAWIREPMRDLVKQLWSEFGKEGSSTPQVFSSLVERLVSYSIPESLNLALVFAQRAFALTKLYEYVHHGQEVDLQNLLQEFPWIIEPDSVFLTANQNLKNVVLKAEAAGLIPQPKKVTVAGVPDTNKPDFVFLSSPDEADIVVVELKNPQIDLVVENREQLYSYMVYLEVHYPEARLRGYLVGRATKGMKMNRDDTSVIPWTDIVKRSRSRYVTFLAAMLASVPEDTVRVDTVKDFAGPDVWELLKKMASKNKRLSDLIVKYQ